MFGNSDQDERNMADEEERQNGTYREPLIPLSRDDQVVSATRHANKVVVVTRYGRVYLVDPLFGSVKETVRK